MKSIATLAMALAVIALVVGAPLQPAEAQQCTTSPCQNGGICTTAGTCDCTGTGFTGPTCETSAPHFVYSVKFLCGLQTLAGSPPNEPPVKPGNYATAVNIHNFHAQSEAVFAKKAVQALPQHSPVRGKIGNLCLEALPPNGAMEVDCTDIVKLLGFPAGTAPPPFIKGFVEVVSPVELSVVGVYTSQTCKNSGPPATSGKCSALGELDLEVVPQRTFLEAQPPPSTTVPPCE